MAVEHNPQQHRYELVEEGLIATADYRRDGDTLLITYVQSPPPLRGKGTAGRLMSGMLDQVRAICGYAAAWIRRHPDYQDLLA
jgi:uncharacterized protein